MEEQKILPIGIESFEKLRRSGFYYVDKTRLIEDLLLNWGEVNLFTRPRRFGKTLNISMLKNFFEIGCDPQLFDGLYISRRTTLCQRYMGKFPVIFLSLKGIEADSFAEARQLLIKTINTEARRFQFLLDSKRLTHTDKELFSHLLRQDMPEDTLVYSLYELTELLRKHYEQEVILLMDEYDVPLAKANEHDYYEPMTLLIRNLFGNVLKTNENLYFAVLTGCLRVAKESIFTGLNNFTVHSITSVDFDEYYGFTDEEVKEMLRSYKLEGDFQTVKDWYDGYRFGSTDIYCPWDVINYCKDRRKNKLLPPQNYWLHTSGNELISHFVRDLGEQVEPTKSELEQLINGGSVQKEIRQDLTYKELYASPENIWSALFMTGYLTQRGLPDGNRYHLAIPNQEIKNIITEQVLALFKASIAQDGKMLMHFCNALLQGQAKEVEDLFTAYMKKTISVRDTAGKTTLRENFYHGLLLGILSFKSDWLVTSNQEAGDGFSDITIQANDPSTGAAIGIVIEVKYTESGRLDTVCQRALAQIAQKHYTDPFCQNGIQRILGYGIACCRKSCRVICFPQRSETGPEPPQA